MILGIEGVMTLIALLAICAVFVIMKLFLDGHINRSDSGYAQSKDASAVKGDLPVQKTTDADRSALRQNILFKGGVKPKTVSASSLISDKIPDFDEQAEIENIKLSAARFILASSSGNSRFEDLNDCCSKAVITAARFETMSTRLRYSAIEITDVEFTRSEEHAQEISLFGIIHAEYLASPVNNKTLVTPFEAIYDFKYSYDYRESTDRKTLKCPKCGAPISDYNVKVCAFCDAELGNMLMKRSWTLTEIKRASQFKKLPE